MAVAVHRRLGALARLLLLVREPADGDPLEAAAMVARLQNDEGQALFGFVRRLGLTDEQADDAVQEVLTRLLAESRRGILIANPRAWAYRSIYRLAMDEHRLRSRVTAIVGALGRRPERTGPEATESIAVWTEVDRLPTQQRHVIYLRYRADLEFEDIGQTLGITASAARSYATKALGTLRMRLGASIEEVADGA
jgi:RNA polymerase sigma factor (sigma-70 family)